MKEIKMKVKTLVLTAATAAIIPVAGAVAPVAADSPGQIETGDIYRVKNVTKNTDYATTATANACEELQYSARFHNPGYGAINHIMAKATLQSGANTSNTSNISATWSDGIGSGASASVNVNLSSAQSIDYENGSAKLLDVDGNVIKTLPDGIVGSGVDVGSLNGSTTEYVIFRAKVNCPTPPKPPVTPPATPGAPAAPTTLVNTGPGSAIAAFVAATIAGAFGYRKYLSRKLSR